MIVSRVARWCVEERTVHAGVDQGRKEGGAHGAMVHRENAQQHTAERHDVENLHQTQNQPPVHTRQIWSKFVKLVCVMVIPMNTTYVNYPNFFHIGLLSGRLCHFTQ